MTWYDLVVDGYGWLWMVLGDVVGLWLPQQPEIPPEIPVESSGRWRLRHTWTWLRRRSRRKISPGPSNEKPARFWSFIPSMVKFVDGLLLPGIIDGIVNHDQNFTIDKHYFYHSVIVNFCNKKHDFSEVHHPTTGINFLNTSTPNTPKTWLLASPDPSHANRGHTCRTWCFYLKEKTKAGKHIVCQIAARSIILSKCSWHILKLR